MVSSHKFFLSSLPWHSADLGAQMQSADGHNMNIMWNGNKQTFGGESLYSSSRSHSFSNGKNKNSNRQKRDNGEEIIARTEDLPGHSRSKSWNSVEFQNQSVCVAKCGSEKQWTEQKLKLSLHHKRSSNQSSSTYKIHLKTENFPALRKQDSKAPFQQKPGFFQYPKHRQWCIYRFFRP